MSKTENIVCKTRATQPKFVTRKIRTVCVIKPINVKIEKKYINICICICVINSTEIRV